MNNNVATQILDILQSGSNGCRFLEERISQGELSLNDIAIFDTMAELIRALEAGTASSTVPNRVKDINANIHFYIEELKRNAMNDNIESFLFDFRYHFCSLFRILELEIAYIVRDFVQIADYPQFYPEIGDVNHEEIIRRGENRPYKASVILLAYNNLEHTRNCVESIIANTCDVDYELILVDNGSTDGTRAYFDSIEGAKVIVLKHNLHIVKGFNIGMMAAEGKYSAVVCNDFIFTPNWLSNLMRCIESNPIIGYVSPGATSISNFQQIDIPFISNEDFQERARAYNVSNPSKWEERVVLLPNVLCCPIALLERIGYYDTHFFRGEFGDDDISFRIRRAGYKLIYCGDTVTHHYGSLTTASDHLTNSYEEGRQNFIDKYGFDPWVESRLNPVYSYFNYEGMSQVKSILGIDVKCGGTLLQIKNRICSLYETEPELSALTSDKMYEPDLITIAKQVETFSTITNLTHKLRDKFDLIFIEQPLDCYSDDLPTVFSSLSELLRPNGKLICLVNNCTNIGALYHMLNSSESLHGRKIYFPSLVVKEAIASGFGSVAILNTTIEQYDQAKISSLAELLTDHKESDSENVKDMLNYNFSMFQMEYQGKA